jgi:hypothetical protein
MISKQVWRIGRQDMIHSLPGENIPKVPQTDADKFSFFSNFTVVQSNSSYISLVLELRGI